MPRHRFVYAKGYDFNRLIPVVRQVHGFVLDKPSRIRRWLVDHGVATAFEEPTLPRDADLRAIHSAAVIDGLSDPHALAQATEFAALGKLPRFLARPMIVRPQLLACDGTWRALAHAANGDWAFNLSGGFHHARPDLSHGFCLVNDVAWAIHRLNASGKRPKILVLDLDLHQGDGNHAFFADRDDVFTASLHQEDTFPQPKIPADLDLGLRGGQVDDRVYLDAVDRLLTEIAERFAPEVVVYVAGTDPFHDDAIGEFAVTSDGLLERDRRVARFVKAQGAGFVALPAGGYSPASPTLSAAGFAAMIEVDSEA